MRELSDQQIDLAVTTLDRLMNSRGLSQTDLAQLSGVNQSTISKTITRSQVPSADLLRKLLQAIGLKLADVLNETDGLGHEILGYLATPLTGVVSDEKCDLELRRVVGEIKRIAASSEFADLPFELYWPGDFTHPVKNPEFPAGQVYLTDRSRASTHDFLILFCAEPSFGVGQENEIATQAGIPAIRLLPKGTSRMMLGSFVRRIDITFAGSLKTGVTIPDDALLDAFRQVRRLYIQNRALFKNINGVHFGDRLRKLIDTRCGSYLKFAEQLGVDISYVNALMDEHPSISNPGLRLMKKMAAILQADTSYLTGESEEADPIWMDSRGSWHAWVTETSGLDATIAVTIRDEWRDRYRSQKVQPSVISHRKILTAMQKTDWDALYKEKLKNANGRKAAPKLF